MYEGPKIQFIFLNEDEVVRTSPIYSGSGSWKDENVDDDGWT